MDFIEEKTYNRHALKIWMKNKAKRMVRKQNKYAINKEFATASMMLNKHEEEEDLTSVAEEREARIERNRQWRQRREEERRRKSQPPTPAADAESEKGSCKDDISSSSGTSSVGAFSDSGLEAFFNCSVCEEQLDGRIWQCQVGHPICKECIDLTWLSEGRPSSIIGGSSTSSSSLVSGQSSSQSGQSGSKSSVLGSNASSRSIISSLSDSNSSNSKNSQQSTLTNGSTSSYDKDSDVTSTVSFSGPTWEDRDIKGIDWFKNTLNIRRDAISPYNDYHRQEDNDEEATASESQVEAGLDVEEDDDDDLSSLGQPLTERELKHFPKDELSLKKEEKKRREEFEGRFAMFPVENNALSDPSLSTESFERSSIDSIDFMAGTLKVKKDVIRAYKDYHSQEKDEAKGVVINDKVEIFQSDDDSSSSGFATKRKASKRLQVNECAVCGSSVLGRNFYLESLMTVMAEADASTANNGSALI